MAALTRAEVLEARRAPSTPPRTRAFVPERVGRVGAMLRAEARRLPAPVDMPPRKEEAACCQARLDDLGRPPLGFCTPECIRRPGNWTLVQRGEPVPRGGVPHREGDR